MLERFRHSPIHKLHNACTTVIPTLSREWGRGGEEFESQNVYKINVPMGRGELKKGKLQKIFHGFPELISQLSGLQNTECNLVACRLAKWLIS